MFHKFKPQFLNNIEEEFSIYSGWKFRNNILNNKFNRYFLEKSIELRKIMIYAIFLFKILIILSYFFRSQENLILCIPFIFCHLLILVISIICNVINFKVRKVAIEYLLNSICFSLSNLNLFIYVFSQALYHEKTMEINFIFVDTFNSYIFCAAYFSYYDNLYLFHFLIQNLLRIGVLVFVKNMVEWNLINFLLMISNTIGLSLMTIFAKYYILKIFKLNYKKKIELSNSIEFFCSWINNLKFSVLSMKNRMPFYWNSEFLNTFPCEYNFEDDMNINLNKGFLNRFTKKNYNDKKQNEILKNKIIFKFESISNSKIDDINKPLSDIIQRNLISFLSLKNEKTNVINPNIKSLKQIINKKQFISLGEFAYNPNILNEKFSSLKSTKNCNNANNEKLRCYEIFMRVYFVNIDSPILDLIFSDLTDIKQEEAKNTEKILKSTVFKKIAHELKTPLMTTFFQLEELNELLENENRDLVNYSNYSSTKFVNDITRKSNINLKNLKSVKKKVKMVTDLIEYTTILISDIIHYTDNETNNEGILNNKIIDVKNELVEFHDDILKALLTYSTGNKNNINYTRSISPDVDNYIIYTDLQKLKQVTVNIISNAVKFTKRGDISIRYSIEKQKFCDLLSNNSNEQKSKINNSDEIIKEKISLIIQITDTGVGISKEARLNLENNKITLNNAINDYNNSSGIGLGLVIIQHIAKKLKYEIELRSETGVGSSFILKIPAIIKYDNYEFSNKKIKSCKSLFEKNISVKQYKSKLKIPYLLY